MIIGNLVVVAKNATIIPYSPYSLDSGFFVTRLCTKRMVEPGEVVKESLTNKSVTTGDTIELDKSSPDHVRLQIR